MNADQFALYMQTLQADQDRAVARQDRSATLATRRDNQRTQERLVDTHIKSTRTCDGSSIPLVREWLHDVDMAYPYFPLATADLDIQKLVMATIQGAMRRYYEHFMDQQPDRRNVTWAAIRTSFKQAYLTPDEAEFLRSELKTIKQTAYETTAAYARRFVEAANAAYDQTELNDIVQNMVLERYVKGLRSKTLRRRLILETQPTTVEQAVLAVEAFAASEERLKRMTPEDEANAGDETPMEIGAIRGPTPSPQLDLQTPPADSAVAAALLTLNRQMQGIQKEITKLKAISLTSATPFVAPLVAPGPATPAVAAPTEPLRYPSHAPDGRQVCYECGGLGHIGKNCEHRRRRLASAAQQSGN
jgi:hypothetical protein